jgi:hypothetical protein
MFSSETYLAWKAEAAVMYWQQYGGGKKRPAPLGSFKISIKALRMLAGCPTGATEDAMRMHGIEVGVLDELVALGLVTVRIQTFANPRGLKVRRFHINQGQSK